METITRIPVKLTDGAISAVKKIMSETGFEAGKQLRFGVKGGGCSGMTYVLDFDTPTDKDFQFEIEGIPCIMEKAHEIYLLDMEVDWKDGLGNRGFTFKNPNASTTCGCGTSFAV
jgi:iron-sulfur cluster assembly protein